MPVSLTDANLVWNDQGSGARDCATVFTLPYSKTAWAIADYPDTITVFDVKNQF